MQVNRQLYNNHLNKLYNLYHLIIYTVQLHKIHFLYMSIYQYLQLQLLYILQYIHLFLRYQKCIFGIQLEVMNIQRNPCKSCHLLFWCTYRLLHSIIWNIDYHLLKRSYNLQFQNILKLMYNILNIDHLYIFHHIHWNTCLFHLLDYVNDKMFLHQSHQRNLNIVLLFYNIIQHYRQHQ